MQVIGACTFAKLFLSAGGKYVTLVPLLSHACRKQLSSFIELESKRELWPLIPAAE